MHSRPIGIFDSGIGGLTVAKTIVHELPNENIVYLGDTARVPYGTRGKEVITQFALQLTKFILDKEVKCIVVACNTISATCLPEIQRLSPIRVIGVVKPAAEAIVKATKRKKVGVIGTNATIQSKIYEKEIQNIDPEIRIFTKACPLFVPLAEEGLAESDIAQLTATYYLSDMRDIDTLHLGCTHYPLLKNVIRKTIGSNIAIIDSAQPTAVAVKDYLTKSNLLNDSHGLIARNFFFTDTPMRMIETAEGFYGSDITKNIHRITL